MFLCPGLHQLSVSRSRRTAGVMSNTLDMERTEMEV